MRSHQIHEALTQGNTRFEICQLVAKGVRSTHRSGMRFEDSISEVLGHLGVHPAPPRERRRVLPQAVEPFHPMDFSA